MPSSPLSRETDLRIAARIAKDVDMQSEDVFILTGSYSIDLLTGADVKHNDIDANVFTKNITSSLGKIGLLLESAHNELTPIKRTDSRLEYLYAHENGSSQLELQFIEYATANKHNLGIDFNLPSTTNQHNVIVPTVRYAVESGGPSGERLDFLVKSLPFAIATWALRISGVALSQKREIRQSDIDHFAYLIKTPHDNAAVLEAITHHPQMPRGVDEQYVLNSSLSVLRRDEK